MPKSTDVPVELRPFKKKFEELCYGQEPSNILSDYLSYIIDGWTYAPGYPLGTVPYEHSTLPGFRTRFDRYSDKEKKLFHALYAEHLQVMSKQVVGTGDWYDLPGIFYESMSQGGSKASLGQFFTPQALCDVMTKIVHSEDMTGKGAIVSDPTCGSGRTLLSFHAHFPGNIMIAEDLDGVCAKMTAVNFLLHGVRGEVIHHDSLNPESWYSGFLVNVDLKPLRWPMPHICKLEKENSIVWRFWQQRREEVAAEKVQEKLKPQSNIQVIEREKFDKPEQLSLF